MEYLKDLLNKYGQNHLLNFYEELSDCDKLKLIDNIKKIDFELINKLYKESFIDEKIDIKKISSLNCIKNKDNINRSFEAGEKIVKNNNYAVVIMAGGNATRLGLNKPKGTLEIKYFDKFISLFNIYINELKEVYNKYGVFINVYIMTSNSNNFDTITYFEKNNYFDYPKDKIKFFVQGELPLLDVNGKLLLKDKSDIWLVPNGNGDVFKALDKYNFIEDMNKNNIKYVLFTTVDNPLTKLVDYQFIGVTINNNYKLASKTIYKKDEFDLNWVFCKYNGKPYMLNDNYVGVFMNVKNNLGDYIYREKNITYHLIDIDMVNLFSKINLPYHRTYKKYNYIDNLGNMVIVEKENAFKFEQFIFDAFSYADDMLLYRITEDEFCPIKRMDDIKKFEYVLKKNK